MDQTTIPGTATSSSKGPVVGIVIVVALLVIGALYFWGARLNEQQTPTPYIPGDTAAPEQAWLPPENTSDEAAAIEADLTATDMNSFDASMKADAAAAASSI